MLEVIDSLMLILLIGGFGMVMFSLGFFMGLSISIMVCGMKMMLVVMGMKFLVGFVFMVVCLFVLGFSGKLFSVVIV